LQIGIRKIFRFKYRNYKTTGKVRIHCNEEELIGDGPLGCYKELSRVLIFKDSSWKPDNTFCWCFNIACELNCRGERGRNWHFTSGKCQRTTLSAACPTGIHFALFRF